MANKKEEKRRKLFGNPKEEKKIKSQLLVDVSWYRHWGYRKTAISLESRLRVRPCAAEIVRLLGMKGGSLTGHCWVWKIWRGGDSWTLKQMDHDDLQDSYCKAFCVTLRQFRFGKSERSK